MEMTNIETDIASALRDIEDSFSDIKEEKDNSNDNSYSSEEIEQTSAALKKLLDTPTKGFSQLVFNVTNKPSGSGDNANAVPIEDDDLVSQDVQKTRDVRLSEEQDESDADIPNLSPIKLFDNQNIVTVDVHSSEYLSDFIGKFHSTQLRINAFFSKVPDFLDSPHPLPTLFIRDVKPLRTAPAPQALQSNTTLIVKIAILKMMYIVKTTESAQVTT